MIFTSARFRKRISPLLRGLPREHPGLPQHRGWGIRGRKGTEGGVPLWVQVRKLAWLLVPPRPVAWKAPHCAWLPLRNWRKNVCILS